MADNNNNKPTQAEKEAEDWMTKKWRPMMALMYMSVCAFDFIVAPILWAIVQFWETQAANDAFRQWQPLTLQGAGLFHMAMGAVLGITAWSRGQEKLAGVTSGSAPSIPGLPSTPSVSSAPATPSFSAPSIPTAPQQSFTLNNVPAVTAGFGGKKAPPPADEPML
jgi:hypothetical protein